MKTNRVILTLLLVPVLISCSLPQASSLVGEAPIPTSGYTLTPEVTPVPPIIPTAIPIIRIDNGDRALANGDYDTALAFYQSAFKDSPELAVRAAAKWGEARVYFEGEYYDQTLISLQTLISEYPDATYLPRAYFLQGQCFYQLGRYTESAAALQLYITLRPNIVDAYVQEMRGDALFEAVNYTDALAAYIAAIQAPRLDDAVAVDLKVGATYVKLGDYEKAYALYDGIQARPVNDYIKAQALYQHGLAYQAEGKNEAAFDKFQFNVDHYWKSIYSYSGLIQLVDGGREVDELQRGLVDYYAGQYDVAIAAFDRYLTANPINDGTAHYYKALSLSSLGNYEGAIQEYTIFIDNYAEHPSWHEAWGEKAFLQWAQLGLYTEAANTLDEYSKHALSSNLSGDYLMSAARTMERSGNLDQAVEYWKRVANDFPAGAQAPYALFLAGVTRFRQTRFDEALSLFLQSESMSLAPEDKARAQLWTGKVYEKQNKETEKQNVWRQAQAIEPGGYYGERARDLLIARQPFEAPAVTNFNIDLSRERADADSWIRLKFNLPADADLSGLGNLAQDLRVKRGIEFWGLGLYEEAHAEFDNLRNELKISGVDSYRLGNYLLEIGLYRLGILALRETLNLAGLTEHTDSMLAPIYFSHARYGLYYSDLLIPIAQEEGISALLLFSVMRQESLFEGFIHSSAGARGLMQIMPLQARALPAT